MSVHDVTTVRPEDLEQHRRELTGYYYRMLGSSFETDDAVQETMVRAWRGIDGFEGRSSVASVNSALQRARATLAARDIDGSRPHPMDGDQQALLARYVDAFHHIPARPGHEGANR